MSSPSPSQLRQVFYISHSLADAGVVENIVARARQLNRQRGITGALLFTGGHFAQWIEGPPQALADTMARIEADPRHNAITHLLDTEIHERRFSDWTMAFLPAPGADDLIEQMLRTPALPPARAERLLRLMVERAETLDA